jgi:hypothetical protein
VNRKPFEGLTNVVRFNWPMYVSSLSLAATSLVAARLAPHPVALALEAGAVLALYLTFASLLASFWIYDASGLYGWEWLPDISPRKVANIHSGFDESSLGLAHHYPDAELTILDFYDPAIHTEPSIARARHHAPPVVGTRSCSSRELPLQPNSQDATFLIFAAHEIRDHAERVAFFREVSRATRGPITVVEHVRDLANFLAFGPGFMHFHSVAEWRSTFADAGLRVTSVRRFTPCVRIWTLQC